MSIAPVLEQLRDYLDGLYSRQGGASQQSLNVVTADHDYPPVAGDFFASITVEDVMGPYVDGNTYIESNFIIESYFEDLWPKFKVSGDSCVVFIVVGDNVTIKNLKFDQSTCTPQEGYNYQQIPIICPGPSCSFNNFINLEMINPQAQPTLGFLGASGVDGRDGATAVAEVDVEGTVVQNVTSYEYVVAAARAIGTFTVLPANRDQNCNLWAAAAEACQGQDGLNELVSERNMLPDTKIVPSTGYLVKVSNTDTALCGQKRQNRLVFDSCEEKMEFVADPYLHLRNEPFYCVDFQRKKFVECPGCAVGYEHHQRLSLFRYSLPICQPKNYSFEMLSPNGTTVEADLQYFCGIDILACTAEINRSPNGAVKLFEGTSDPTGGIGAVLVDTSSPRPVAQTSSGIPLGGFGYSALLDKDVVRSIIIEPNDATFQVDIEDPTLTLLNISYYTNLFGKTTSVSSTQQRP